jgi:hypothetical protein
VVVREYATVSRAEMIPKTLRQEGGDPKRRSGSLAFIEATLGAYSGDIEQGVIVARVKRHYITIINNKHFL